LAVGGGGVTLAGCAFGVDEGGTGVAVAVGGKVALAVGGRVAGIVALGSVVTVGGNGVWVTLGVAVDGVTIGPVAEGDGVAVAVLGVAVPGAGVREGVTLTGAVGVGEGGMLGVAVGVAEGSTRVAVQVGGMTTTGGT